MRSCSVQPRVNIRFDLSLLLRLGGARGKESIVEWGAKSIFYPTRARKYLSLLQSSVTSPYLWSLDWPTYQFTQTEQLSIAGPYLSDLSRTILRNPAGHWCGFAGQYIRIPYLLIVSPIRILLLDPFQESSAAH